MNTTAGTIPAHRDPPELPIPAHGIALLAGLVRNKKITKYHGSWAVFFVENAFLNMFLGEFLGPLKR